MAKKLGPGIRDSSILFRQRLQPNRHQGHPDRKRGRKQGEVRRWLRPVYRKNKWITKDSWGASYSSPSRAVIHGKEVCLVFTGGESRPPVGGLLVIDPQDGKKLTRFPWRSSKYESANAVPPLPVGDNRVFLSECYEKGGVLLKFDKDFNPSVIWSDETLNVQWMTPVLSDGALYGVAGRHQQGAEVFCINPVNGKAYWRDRIRWREEIDGRILELELFRGAFLKVEDFFVCLSEIGSLLTVKMDQKGWRIVSKNQLFFAPGAWTLPALSKGLLSSCKTKPTGERDKARESSATTFDKGDEHDPNHRSSTSLRFQESPCLPSG